MIPVHVLTGFLGSGKTTLLQHLLRAPALADTAVIVNELGEIAIDHDVLARIDGETVVLAGGCLCCALRDDVLKTVRALLGRRERGEVPLFRRVLIETTGLADPAPIVRTLLADPVIRHHVSAGNIIATLDATHGDIQVRDYLEVARQLLLADRIVITKTDIASADKRHAVARIARAINPAAITMLVDEARANPADLIVDQMIEEVGHAASLLERARASGPISIGTHTTGVEATCLIFHAPLDWTGFGLWLGLLLHRHGERVLRTKALLNVAERNGPVLVQSVQHTVYPPQHLAKWPSADRRTRIVVIAKDLARSAIESSLAAFCGAAIEQRGIAGRRGAWPAALRESPSGSSSLDGR